jgi:hypothetical protein
MPRGDKSKYTGKQEREADHIAESYESRGVPAGEGSRAQSLGNSEQGKRRREVAANAAARKLLAEPSNGPPQESF